MSRKRWKLAASVSMASSGSAASSAKSAANAAGDSISSTFASLTLGDLLQAGGDLLEGLRQRLVELRVGLRGAAHGGIHVDLPGEPRGVTDVIGGRHSAGRAAGGLWTSHSDQPKYRRAAPHRQRCVPSPRVSCRMP